ncbi:MAG: hypothetical protein ACJ79L_01695 [Anaeromyxobacteraceae bacterium]
MLRELIEKEVSVVKDAVHAVREWVSPTVVMKRHEFDRPLDDLGQTIDDVERRVDMLEHRPGAEREAPATGEKH